MEQMIILPELRLDAVLAASIEALRHYAPPDGKPYWGAFSGGKDSIVLKEVTRMSGVSVEWHYNNVTIDPPELVRFIREHHSDVRWEQPKRGFFKAMRTRGFPTRRQRWCCDEFKESRTPVGRVLLTGIRAAESPRRASTWKTATMHRRTGALVVSPLYHWSDAHVWAFIRASSLPYCSLYDEGFTRLGCVGCPMAGSTGRKQQFARWPRYERAWKSAMTDVWLKSDSTRKKFPSAEALWQ